MSGGHQQSMERKVNSRDRPRRLCAGGPVRAGTVASRSGLRSLAVAVPLPAARFFAWLTPYLNATSFKEPSLTIISE